MANVTVTEVFLIAMAFIFAVPHFIRCSPLRNSQHIMHKENF